MWPLGIQTSCLRSGCPSIGKGRHRDCLSSSGMHDAPIRCRATKITDRSSGPRILSTAGSILNGGRVFTIPIPQHWHGIDVFGPQVQEWWCEDRQFPVRKVANRSITGVPHEENTGWRNHPFCQKGLAHMRESICLDVAWTWKVNWHELDVLPVAKLKEPNHQAGQSEWFGTTFLDYVRHNHGVVAHQAHYMRLVLSLGHGYTQEHCLHLILMCWLACCMDHIPCSLWEPSCASICAWMHL